MNITIFSFLMALLWFLVFSFILVLLTKRDSRFIVSFSVFPLVLLAILSLLRLMLNFEYSKAKIFTSRNIYPTIYNFLNYSMGKNNYNIKVYQILIIIWIFGSILCSIIKLIQYINMKKYFSKIRVKKNYKYDKILNKILNKNNINKKIVLLVSEDIFSPMILGVFNTKIYIPNYDFSNEELKYSLLHEVNHYLHKDLQKKYIMILIQILFWWNPLIYILLKKYDNILEIQCDIKTIQNMDEKEKINYLKNITKVIHHNIKSTSRLSIDTNMTLIGSNQLHDLKQRFAIVLDYKKPRKIQNIVICILITIIFFSSYSFVIQPEFTPKEINVFEEKHNEKEDNFILINKEKKYEIYIHGILKEKTDNIDDEIYKQFPIYKKEDY